MRCQVDQGCFGRRPGSPAPPCRPKRRSGGITALLPAGAIRRRTSLRTPIRRRGAPEGGVTMDITRRSFLTKGSLGAVGALGVIGAPTAAMAAVTKAQENSLSPDEAKILEQPFVVHLRDANTGELELLVGEKAIVFKNKALVAKVLRAAR